MLDGRVLAEKGVIVDLDDPARIPVDRRNHLDWDASRQALVVPFQVQSGGNRDPVRPVRRAARGAIAGAWVSGGVVLAGRADRSQPRHPQPHPAALRIDPGKQRIDLEPSRFSGADLGVALNGSLDFSGDDPRLALGIAGTRMSVATMKRLWPVTPRRKVRAWVDEHPGRHGRAAGHLDQRAVVDAQSSPPCPTTAC